MAEIKIEIQSCKQCPFFKTTNEWSSDGWDRMEDWICTKHPENSSPVRIKGYIQINDGKGKLIQSCVEWHEEKKIQIPQWCPIKI